VEKTYYSADSLASVLPKFEEHYGMTSEDFYAAHMADEGLPEGLTGFNRHVWASFYRDVLRFRDRSFAEHAERVLAL